MSNLSQKSDHQLVEMYANGTDEAFDELLARHQERVFSYILRLVHNEDLANDIFQDTFIKAITSMRSGKYQATGNFGAWLMRIAHNVTIDTARRNPNKPDMQEDIQSTIINNSIQMSEASCEQEILRICDSQTLHDLVDRLPEAQREIVHLRFWEDLSFKEISEITGVGINTALGRMHYALGNLRRIAAEYQLDIAI